MVLWYMFLSLYDEVTNPDKGRNIVAKVIYIDTW
jgi:hypothetical protein